NGGLINTLRDQTYRGAVSLGADATTASIASSDLGGGSIAFQQTVDSDVSAARGLLVKAPATEFDQAVGGTRGLSSLTTDAAGVTTLKGNVNANTVDFQDAVTLAGNVTVQKDNGGASAAS